MGTAGRKAIIPLGHQPPRRDPTFDDTEKQAEGESLAAALSWADCQGHSAVALSASVVGKIQTHSLWLAVSEFRTTKDFYIVVETCK